MGIFIRSVIDNALPAQPHTKRFTTARADPMSNTYGFPQ
jgi:hypothetical protein